MVATVGVDVVGVGFGYAGEGEDVAVYYFEFYTVFVFEDYAVGLRV